MEANRHGREDHSRVTLTPDMIMHVLRLHRRQALAYIERRENLGDVDSDDDDDDDDDDGGGGAYVLVFSDGEEGENSECSIS
ncbi:hypothetical protein KY285_008709 [Solanum tuberosum]|nr:hypothetical protein KY285_008709 [Solanum tuberosum]